MEGAGDMRPEFQLSWVDSDLDDGALSPTSTKGCFLRKWNAEEVKSAICNREDKYAAHICFFSSAN